MDIEALYRPSYALVIAKMEAGESLVADSSVLGSMSYRITVGTNVRGGLLGGLKLSVIGGESFFMNTFRASLPGEVTVAAALPGDIILHKL